MSYSSDLTDKEYEIIEPLINRYRITRPFTRSLRSVLNGILYQVKNGSLWRDIPKDLASSSTCHYYFRKWTKDGTWKDVLQTLHNLERQRIGKKSRPYLVNS